MQVDAKPDGPISDCDVAPWYVAHTKPRQEQVAVENLVRQNYRVYLPRLKVLANCRRLPEQFAFEPLFPRYLFFRPGHARHSIAPVQSTTGMSTIVRFGGIPAVLRPDVIAGLRDFESRQHQADVSELCPVQAGSAVVVTSGALAGLRGVVAMISKQRVLVLMHLLGEETKVRMKRSELQLAA